MAIERVQRLELAFPASRRDEVLRTLHAAEIVHLDEPDEELLAAGAERASVSTEELDANVAALTTALEVYEQHLRPAQSLLKQFSVGQIFGVMPHATREQLLEAARDVDVATVGDMADDLQDTLRRLAKREADAKGEIEALRPFVGLSFSGADLQRVRGTTVVLGRMGGDGFNALRLDPGAESVAWEEVRRDKRHVMLLVCFRPADAEVAWNRLREHGFEEMPFPQLEVPAAERIAELNSFLQEVDREREEAKANARPLAEKCESIRRTLAYWEDQRELCAAASMTASLKRSGVLTGWVRDRDLAGMKLLLSDKLPFASASFRLPQEGEEPPVSIRLPALLRPMQLLINMFGLPEYRSFDPTAWLTLSFLIFFGACFGDVVYGLMLMGVSLHIMHKHRHSWVRGFFQLFLYAGIFAVIFGLLTGTWMGDLLTGPYLGEDRPLAWLAKSCQFIDPMKKALAALAIALGLGIVNQFYGITLRMGMEIRKKDYAAAFFDAGLWLVMLPGLLIVIAPMFVPGVPGSMITVGWCLLGIGALGLVLTQGRNEEGGFAVKAVTGVVSLYGILGTYGATSFIGDMLSYSRLVALGLTTTIIGMSINIIANLLKDVPYVGLILFVLMLVVGHIGNFVMSILGAFVHPARLVLLEFFNRFYTAGGERFQPLGFDSNRVEIVKERNA